jgi:prepilin-type N-terminal cleavage/methylation domain-containing protein
VNNVRSGFSYIELVIVVLIISILSAVAAPRYLNALENTRVDAIVKRVVADMQIAKRRAQLTSKNQTVTFLVSENRYEIVGMNDLDHPNQSYGYRLGANDGKAKLISANFGGSSDLGFDIYGRPANTGTIVIDISGSNHTITIEESGQVDAPTRAEIVALNATL